MRARLLVSLALLAAALCPAVAHATAVGMSDQDPASFADGRLRALGLGYARLVVPYDAATTEPAWVQAWLSAVAPAAIRGRARAAARRTVRITLRPTGAATRSVSRSLARPAA